VKTNKLSSKIFCCSWVQTSFKTFCSNSKRKFSSICFFISNFFWRFSSFSSFFFNKISFSKAICASSSAFFFNFFLFIFYFYFLFFVFSLIYFKIIKNK
jgi:hypothetical protein